MTEPSEPSLGEINRRLLRIEEKMDRSFVNTELYQAEKHAAIEARQGLESRIEVKTVARDARITSLENTITWLVRAIITAFIGGAVTAVFYVLQISN